MCFELGEHEKERLREKRQKDFLRIKLKKKKKRKKKMMRSKSGEELWMMCLVSAGSMALLLSPISGPHRTGCLDAQISIHVCLVFCLSRTCS